MRAKKLKMHTTDITQANIKKIQELFPSCINEATDSHGRVQLSVDFNQLQQELGNPNVDESQERYRLEWPGKRNAKRIANTPVAKTLRPIQKDSIDFYKSGNLFIEGDNLHVLKLLQESYLGKIKIIYIDPPYNTGKDRIYQDDFNTTMTEYLIRSNRMENGQQLVSNVETNGRFHSDWLSNIYPRLRLSRNLLRQDGVIFISISDHEINNLKHICDEIYGESNHIGTIVWNSTKSVTNTALISVGHTYNLVYARDKNYFIENRSHFRLPETGEGFSNPDNDHRGPWKADPFKVGGWRPNQQYSIFNPKTGDEFTPGSGSSWKNDFNKFTELMQDHRIVFGISGEAGPQRKRFLSEAKKRGKVAKTWWDDVGTTTNGTEKLNRLFDGTVVFSNPKPVDLIERFICLGDHTEEGIVLDFFAGSGTTAEAVLSTNAQGANRKFIVVQIAEEIDVNSKDLKETISYLEQNNIEKNIAAICRERIERVSAKICEQNPNVDGGFRTLKVDSSNMKDIFYRPEDLAQQDLFSTVDNLKEDRKAEDLLFQVLIDCGMDLSLPIRREHINGLEVFFVGQNSLVACFDIGVTEELVNLLTDYKPSRIVFRDSGLTSDDLKINFQQIIQQNSPTTEIMSI